MKTYGTFEIANIVGVHPNTIRFYEQMQFLPPVPQEANGSRVFTHRHLLQARLVRAAYHQDQLSGELREALAEILKSSARGEIQAAMEGTAALRERLRGELDKAGEALGIIRDRLAGKPVRDDAFTSQKETGELLGLSIHTIRNWENSGLLVSKKKGGRRIYGEPERNRLRIAYILRCANFSISQIALMLQALDEGSAATVLGADREFPGERVDLELTVSRYAAAVDGALQSCEVMEQLLEQLL